MSKRQMIVFLVLVAIAASCHTGAEKAAIHLDSIERDLEEWGHTSASGFLIFDSMGQFKIDYAKEPDFYADRTRETIAASAGRLQEAIRETRAAIGVQRDKTLADDAAPEGGSVAAPEEVKVKTELSGAGKFRDPQTLNGKATGVSEGVVLNQTFSHKLQELLLKNLVNPESLAGNQNAYFFVFQVSCNPGWRTRKGYIADVNLTIEYSIALKEAIANAQKRATDTRNELEKAVREFYADKTVAEAELKQLRNEWTKFEAAKGSSEALIQYGSLPIPSALERLKKIATKCEAIDKYSTHIEAKSALAKLIRGREDGTLGSSIRSFSSAGEIIQPGLAQPICVSVFPLLESQQLDLRNSEREQQAYAIQLSALFREAGMTAAANAVIESVDRNQFDAASRTSRAIMTSYSNGISFGYRFYPSLTALEDPSSNKSDAALVLEPASFPVVAMLVTPDLQNWGEFAVTATTNWIPLKKSGALRANTVDAVARSWNGAASTKSRRNLDRVRRGRDWDVALDEMIKAYKLDGGVGNASLLQREEWRELRRRLDYLQATGLSTTYTTPIPKKAQRKPHTVAKPTITGTSMKLAWINAATAIHIEGTNFRTAAVPRVHSVTVAGRRCEFEVTSDTSIFAVVPALGLAAGQANLHVSVATSGGTSAMAANGITLQAAAEREPPAVELGYEGDKLKSLTVTNASEVDPTALLTLVREILAKHQLTADFKVDLTQGTTTSVESKVN